MPDDRIKRPAYQWYVNDARGDEIFMLMTYEQQGIYRALLDHQWVEGSIPADPHHIAHLLPKITTARFLKLWPLISGKFRPHAEGRLLNDRLESQRKLLDEFVQKQAAKGRISAQKRKEASTAVGLRLQPNANSSSSTSSSTSQTVVKEQPQVPDKAPSPAKVFLSWFQTEYKTRRHGATYFVSWDKHMPIVGRLLKLHAPDRLRKHAIVLLTTNEPWTETTDRGIEVLAGKINWLEEKLCAWEAKKRGREAV